MATDFAHFEHEQLIAMLDGNTPPLILASADNFHSLAIRVDRSARSLAARVRDLDWHGESAEAFKQWAHDVMRAAGELSEFVRETGQQLRVAGEQLAGTQLPAVNAADQMLAKSQDETARANALQRLSAAKSEAVRQMQALGSTYRVAAENLSTLKEPRFPQPANLLGIDVQALNAFPDQYSESQKPARNVDWPGAPDAPDLQQQTGSIPRNVRPGLDWTGNGSHSQSPLSGQPALLSVPPIAPIKGEPSLLSVSENPRKRLINSTDYPTVGPDSMRDPSGHHLGSPVSPPSLHPLPGQAAGRPGSSHPRVPYTPNGTSGGQEARVPRSPSVLQGIPLTSPRPTESAERGRPGVTDEYSLAVSVSAATVPAVIE